ncbi:hypothetical protein C4553_02055 [Candidatus Parcubacteria bacterium]|nr:MAG: hypothetical protein C4553_02055 [Candidatus Parcubacteria bacterium]
MLFYLPERRCSLNAFEFLERKDFFIGRDMSHSFCHTIQRGPLVYAEIMGDELHLSCQWLAEQNGDGTWKIIENHGRLFRIALRDVNFQEDDVRDTLTLKLKEEGALIIHRDGENIAFASAA